MIPGVRGNYAADGRPIMASDLSIDLGSVEQPGLTPMVKTRMPRLGEIVTFYQGDAEAAAAAKMVYDPEKPELFHHLNGINGTRFHAAIVTRVWSATCVNLSVFFDTQPPQVRPSATLLPDFPPDVHCRTSGWRFSPD
jgi:hypothetical protein